VKILSTGFSYSECARDDKQLADSLYANSQSISFNDIVIDYSHRGTLLAPPPFGAQMRREWALYLTQLGGFFFRKIIFYTENTQHIPSIWTFIF
jgi:hypothetical protein